MDKIREIIERTLAATYNFFTVRRRGSEFVQQAVIIALVVLTLVAILATVSTNLRTAFNNIASCIASIATGSGGAGTCGGITQR